MKDFGEAACPTLINLSKASDKKSEPLLDVYTLWFELEVYAWRDYHLICLFRDSRY